MSDLRTARRFAYENPRPDVQALVPASARRVLDLGCSSGALGAALKARQGCEVVGVEADPDYAADAEARLDEVVVADLEGFDPTWLGRFDCVVAADVLEHLRDPWAVLARCAETLDPGAHAVISLPNVRYWETFWQLAKGNWPRRPEGIFDATHLRWFTLADARALLEQAGLEPLRESRRMRLRPSGWRHDERLQRLEHVRVIRAFLAFQHVILARRR